MRRAVALSQSLVLGGAFLATPSALALDFKLIPLDRRPTPPFTPPVVLALHPTRLSEGVALDGALSTKGWAGPAGRAFLEALVRGATWTD